ncbi:MAG: hypothetical protein ABL952_06815, partial [Pyrinomonadaceae bacterium]
LRTRWTTRVIVMAALLISATVCAAQTTAFTYQGRLTEASMPATGTYDFQFALYDAAGTLINPPAPIVRSGVAVTNGAFVVQLDFGTAGFPSADRYLEIRVKRPADPSYVALTPRQRITSTPYAIRANNSTFSDFATFASSSGNAQTATTAGSATTATTADNVTGVVAVANGGTGSSTKNFVDTGPVDQFVGGAKTFSNAGGNGANLANVVVMTDLSNTFTNQTLPNGGQFFWVFLGQPALMQINSGQKMSVTGTVIVRAASAMQILFDVCTRNGTTVVPIGPFPAAPYPTIGTTDTVWTYSYGNRTLSPGVYEIGLCAENVNSLPNTTSVTGRAMGFTIVAR